MQIQIHPQIIEWLFKYGRPFTNWYLINEDLDSNFVYLCRFIGRIRLHILLILLIR